MNEMNFQYLGIKEFLNINTLSLNKSIYYKISRITEISMAWWVWEIAFFDKSNSLIYHRPEVRVAWLGPYYQLRFVKWSYDGNYVLIFEYKRNIINDYLLLD